jgi:hypothetical protein
MKEDTLINLWTVMGWNAEEVRLWALGVVSKEDRSKLEGITGRQLLDNEYPALSLKSQTSVQQRIRKWQTDAKNSQPLLSWVKNNANATHRANWLSRILKHGVLSAMSELGDALIFQQCDPPIGDGQCQCRAAQNALTIHKILTNPSVNKKWKHLQNQLSVIADEDPKNIEANLSNMFNDNQWLMDVDLVTIWHLIKCHIVTLGKITSQTSAQSTAQLSTLMSTDRHLLGQSLQINNNNAVDHLLFVMRDQISKESIRFLRHHIRHNNDCSSVVAAHSIISWWSEKQASELCGMQWTVTVRGWPSVPMFWSYASLIRILWDQIPIVAKIRHLKKTENGYSVVHLNRHVVNSAVAWVIEGCSQLTCDQVTSVPIHQWVEWIMMSVADHPQYPIESNSPEYKKLESKKLESADYKNLMETLPKHRLTTALLNVETTQEHPGGVPSLWKEIALEETFRAKMLTEQPHQADALAPYPKYRDDAAKHGCTAYNPANFLVKHVYPNSVAIALADPHHHHQIAQHISPSILLLIYHLL